MQFYPSKLLNSKTNVRYSFTTKDDKNLAFHVNDNPAHVHKNHEILAHKLGYKKDSLIHMKQIHSSLVYRVNDKDNFSNPQKCDALITNKKNIPLMVMVADCSPILFYDDVNEVIAVAHAGRQGAFKNIVKNTLQSMHLNFQTSMQNIKVIIGPSIAKCCYEVGEEIYQETLHAHLDYAIKNKGNTYYLDISSILMRQLLDEGILKKNIDISKDCTCCKSDIYNSYRAEPDTGRFCGVIFLK